MRTSDWLTFSIAAVAIIIGLLALIENLSSLSSLASQKRKTRAPWTWTFVVLLLVLVALAISQENISIREHNIDKEQAQLAQTKFEAKMHHRLDMFQASYEALSQLLLQKDRQIAELARGDLSAQQRESALNYAAIIELVYHNNQLQLYNAGRTNLYLWGEKLDDTAQILATVPRALSPGTSYYFFGDKLVKWALAQARHPILRIPFELYLSDELKRKHIAKFILLIHLNRRTITAIQVQMIESVNADWVQHP
jgi:hypothetical protein